MGMVPELPVAMLACARLGAPHTVVFGGFSADSLSDRLNDMGCEVLITQDEACAAAARCRSSANADEALARRAGRRSTPSSCAAPAATSAGPRGATSGGTSSSREESDDPASCPCEPMDAEDLLYLLYTSGTTAKPKGIVHTTAGYLVGVATTHHYIFDVKPDSVYWCAADIGWVTGPQLHRLRAALQRHDRRASTRACRTTRTRTAGGRSSSATTSTSSTRRRPRSART